MMEAVAAFGLGTAAVVFGAYLWMTNGDEDGATIAETSNEDPRDDTDSVVESVTDPFADDIEFEGSVSYDDTTVIEFDFDLEDVLGVGETKAERLRERGFQQPADLYYASDNALKEVSGIGDNVLEQIRDDIGGIDYTDDEDDEA